MDLHILQTLNPYRRRCRLEGTATVEMKVLYTVGAIRDSNPKSERGRQERKKKKSLEKSTPGWIRGNLE